MKPQTQASTDLLRISRVADWIAVFHYPADMNSSTFCLQRELLQFFDQARHEGPCE